MPDGSDLHDFALAIDIGGTKAAFSFVGVDGQLLTPIEKHLVPFDAERRADPQGILKIIAPYIERASTLPGHLRGVGLSCCGAVDHVNGVAVLVSNLRWRYVPIGAIVRNAFNIPVFTAADVRMAILAEATWGAARGVRNAAWATVGTGYGGHLWLEGKLYDGSHGLAGNFGHTTLDEVKGEMCGCGRRGCFETYVAGPAIARAGQNSAESGESAYLASLSRNQAVSTRDVFEAEAAGDPAAITIIENVIRLICVNLSGMVNLLDLDLIVMGGGVVQGNTDFVPRINRRIRDFLMTEEAIRDLKVVKETYENSALVGAAAEVFTRQGLLSR